MASRARPTLTDGQVACLQLVAANLTSKEIAVQLGISPHTVDQRVRGALRQLGVQNRRQAARLVQPKRSSLRGMPASSDHPGEDELTEAVQPRAGRIVAGLTRIPLPIATATRPKNTMGIAARLLWIAAIALAAMTSTAMYLAGLESLARLLRN
jgi:DNA-binding CsgD family transcriptional regulator